MEGGSGVVLWEVGVEMGWGSELGWTGFRCVSLGGQSQAQTRTDP